MELLCLTGVEDKLQKDVKPTLELLRNAGIKVYLLLHIYHLHILWFCLVINCFFLGLDVNWR